MESDPGAPEGQVLYQIICLWDTPPLTSEEQHRCLHAANGCWRANHPANRQNGRNGQGVALDEAREGQGGPEGQAAAEGNTREKRNGRNGQSRPGRKKNQAREA